MAEAAARRAVKDGLADVAMTRFSKQRFTPTSGIRLTFRAGSRVATLSVARAADSVLQGNQTSKCWVRETVFASFHVTCEPVIESRVSNDRHDQVIPTKELSQ